MESNNLEFIRSEFEITGYIKKVRSHSAFIDVLKSGFRSHAISL